MYLNKPTNASICALSRRQREDVSPRLLELIPRLHSLSIRVDERMMTSPKYVRRIVVRTAPALFVLPCGDQNCREGGHDISDVVLAALRLMQDSFSGSHQCTGWIGGDRCKRTIWYVGEAEYVSVAPRARHAVASGRGE